MSAVFMVGDVRARMTQLDDASFDFILCSPPFLALRSYLPDEHPDKAKEIGSEATPAEFLDVLLELTAEWGRLLAPHGSIAIELGDTYAGSGGAGGDYDENGLRADQARFNGAAAVARAHAIKERTRNPGPGWPLDKSLACIPQLYQVALAYGINPLTGSESPAGRWRVRNLKPWIRSNPPVGALGDKERPATSYVIVATRSRDRWFDLDAVRTTPAPRGGPAYTGNRHGPRERDPIGDEPIVTCNAAGAPPRDWWHHVDAVLDAELATRRAEPDRHATPPLKHGKAITGDYNAPNIGAQGVHLRRALERAGILRTVDALDVSPRGYTGAHYAVWPPELVRLLIDEMCPRRVCTTCGQPSRRIVETTPTFDGKPIAAGKRLGTLGGQASDTGVDHNRFQTERTTVGWSDCGHGTWRPGRILDPFVGSGTTLAVASGMARDAVGIDIDERNAWLAQERVGVFLTIDQPHEATA